MNKVKNKKNSVAPLSFLMTGKGRILMICALTFVLYGNTLFHDFTLDDAIVITDNEFTQKGFGGLKDIFTKDTFHGFFGEAGKDKLVSGGRYRPFTLATFAVERAIFGETPIVHHFVNIVLYGLLGIVIFLFAGRVFNQRFESKLAGFLAFATAVLFIAHPIHTEAVANIKGRDEIMAMLGSMSALYWLIRKPLDKLKLKDYFLSALLFFIGLLSKENAITFVAVAPLAAWIFFKNPAKIMLPFLLPALLFMVLRTAVIGFDLGAAPSLEFMNNPYLKVVNGQYVNFTATEKYATIMHTLFKYVQLLFVPWPLTHDYYPNHISLKTFADVTSIAGVIIYLGLGIISFLGILKKKTWAFFTAYYLITISIVSNIVFPIGTHMSERFIFMPSLAFAGLMSMFLYRWNPKVGTSMLLLLLIPYITITINRNTVWKNNFTLFTEDAMISTNSAKVNNAAGGAISDRVKNMEEGPDKMALIKRGQAHLQKAIEIHPNYLNAYLLQGNMFFYEKKYEEAISMYNRCLSIDPSYPDALTNKFLALRAAGRFQGEQLNNLSRAAELLEQAITMQPDDFETNRLLGTCYGIMGQHQKALNYFKKCADLQPNNASIFVNLAKAYEFVGNTEKAKEAAERANTLNKSN